MAREMQISVRTTADDLVDSQERTDASKAKATRVLRARGWESCYEHGQEKKKNQHLHVHVICSYGNRNK